MKTLLIYLLGSAIIALLIHNAAKTKDVPESTIEQKQIHELQNEVENLRYQLNQCRSLYRSL